MKRIVVIEDSRTQAQMLVGVLSREGFEVSASRDGASGIAVCVGAPPDLVISDIVMPGIDGFEVCRRLKAHPATRDVPVMLLTSLSDPTDVVRSLAAGADNFLTKPYDDGQLVARVRRLLAPRAGDGGALSVEIRGQSFEVRSRPAQVLDVLVSSLEAVTARNTELEQSRALVESALTTAERRATQLRGLTEASLAINSAGSLDAALRVVTDQARLLVDARKAVASLLVAQDWSQAITAESHSGAGDGATALDESMLARAVCESNKPLRLSRAELGAHPAHAAGVRVPRGWLGAPLIDGEGQNIGLIHVSDRADGDFSESDESVLVQLAQGASVAVQNARLYEQTRRAVQVRDEIVAVVSHDLRNPLNALLMAVSIAEKSLHDPEGQRNRLAVIRRSAERMNRLILDLLDVTRIDSGHLVLDRARVPVAQLLDDVVQAQGPLAESRSLKLRAELLGEPPAISADRERLFQVFANLIGNAVKFTPAGGVITVRGGPCTEGRGEVRFSVSDTGRGISPEDLAHVFDRFWQERRTAGQGTGLGLSIVKGIVEAHQGRVWCESVVGEGSTFYFTLPVEGAE